MQAYKMRVSKNYLLKNNYKKINYYYTLNCCSLLTDTSSPNLRLFTICNFSSKRVDIGY